MKNRGWILLRVDKLPDVATTAEVRDTLKLTHDAVHRWSVNEYATRNRVCWRENGRVYWDKEKLRIWIIAVAKCGDRKRSTVGTNPPITREQARRHLGMD